MATRANLMTSGRLGESSGANRPTYRSISDAVSPPLESHCRWSSQPQAGEKETGDAFSPASRHGEGHVRAFAGADQDSGVDPLGGQHADDVVGPRVDRVRLGFGRRIGRAATGEIGHEQPIAGGQVMQLWLPHRRIEREPVEQHDDIAACTFIQITEPAILQ